MSPVLNTATKVYAGATAATKVYAGSVQAWSGVAAPTATVDVRAALITTPLATSHVIPLTATVPGRDLIAFGHSAAVFTLPSPWTRMQQVYLGGTDVAIWRLTAASHTASLSSLTVTLSGARRMCITVLESSITGTIYSTFYNNTNPISGGAAWGTGVHTFTKAIGLAIYTGSTATASIDSAATYDQGYAGFADTGNTPVPSTNAEVQRIYVAKKEPGNIASNGVTASLSPVLPSLSGPTCTTGMMGWDVL